MALIGSWWRRYRRGGAAALVGLAGLGLLTFGPAGLAFGAQDYTQRQARAAAAAVHHPGTEVRDGPVSFVVHTVHCGLAGKSRYGQVCQVTVGARNDGDGEVTVPASAQKLHGSEGARHAPLTGEREPFGTLAPGEAATATIRFDLPPHSTATHVEVHATAYTRGQAVAVGEPLPLLPLLPVDGGE